MLQLVAQRHTSAHIIAFVAGPSKLGQHDVPGLINRLQGARLDIIMLASAAEVGSSTVQALQSLVDGLNGGASTAADTLSSTRPACSASQGAVSEGSGRFIRSNDRSAEALCESAAPLEACSRQAACPAGASSEAAWHGPEAAEKQTSRANRLVFVQPPQEGLEVWQQLEPLMELLECSDTADSRRSTPSSAEPVLTVPSTGSCPDPASQSALSAAQQGAGFALNRPATNANAAQLWQQQNQVGFTAPTTSLAEMWSTLPRPHELGLCATTVLDGVAPYPIYVGWTSAGLVFGRMILCCLRVSP